ncbi:MAG: carboxypeptidase regulatory-like domain-containing protein [Bacteroidia bacterium]|nr:carboxypeptidase regulatory-like domain-containing protein [Bacteroidia bacterium]
MTPKVEGEVYTIQGNETIQLNSALVKLLIEELDSNAFSYNIEYETHTDSLGKYLIEIRYVPVIANYTIVFSKPGYSTLTFRKRLRRSKNITFFAELSKTGQQGDENKTVGNFDPKISYFDPHPGVVVLSIFLILILTFLAIRYNTYQFIMDFYQQKTVKGFDQLKESKQRAIIEQAFCSNCLAYNSMLFEREEHIQGMVWLHGKCGNCDSNIKVRWK